MSAPAFSVIATVLNMSGNQTGFISPDLYVGVYSQLAVDLNLTSLTGGTAPTVNVVTKRKGVDGIYYTVDSPTALTAAGAISRSLGVGASQPVALGGLIQILVVVNGAPTGAAWTLSVQAK